MDIYQTTTEYLLKLPIFDSWHEIGSILRRSAATRPRDWELPVIACEALGQAREMAIPASAALACAQISVILVDDMLDDDPRGEYHRIGNGRAVSYCVDQLLRRHQAAQDILDKYRFQTRRRWIPLSQPSSPPYKDSHLHLRQVQVSIHWVFPRRL